MNREESITSNFVFNIILTISTFIFPLITFPYASRILLPEGTGKVATATSFVRYFLLVSQLGIPTYGIRTCAKYREDNYELTKTVQELFIINCIMSAVTYFFLFLSIALIPSINKEKELYVVLSSLIFFNTIGMEWLFKGLEKYKYISIRSIVFKIVALVMMFALVKTKDDYIIYGGITIIASSFSYLFNFLYSRKLIGWKPVKKLDLKKHIHKIMIFFGMSVATTVYINLDNVMLGFMTSFREVGIYNVSVQVRSVLLSIVTSLGVVLLPRASYYLSNGKKNEFIEITKDAINYVMIASMGLFVFFFLNAKQVILVLAGRDYLDSVIPMRILLLTIIIAGFSHVTGIEILVPMGKERYVMISEVFGAITDLVLNYFLIPRFGAIGASFATVMAEIIVLVVQCLAIKDSSLNIVAKDALSLKLVVALLISSIAFYLTKSIFANRFIQLILSAIVFFGSYFVFLMLFKERLINKLYLEVRGKMPRKK